MQLKQKIVSGLGWNLTGSLCTQLINFGTKVVTARLLLPADFGLFAMAFIFLNFLNSFVGMGIMSALIARKNADDTVWSTGFMLSFILGVVYTFACFFASSFISSFFQQPMLKPMIQLLSIVFFFDSLSSVYIGILVRGLAFKRKILAELGSLVCYSILVIVLALQGYGVWSIVIAYVVQHGLLTFFLWLACTQKPGFSFDHMIAKELLHFGTYVLSTSFFAWAITTIDNIFVGKQLREEQLGYYSLGFTVGSLPVLSITHVLTSVFHPVYSQLQDDVIRLKTSYLKPLEWSLLLMLPFSVGLFLLAKPFVLVLFGEKWMSLIPLLKIFSVYCIFRTIATISSQLLEATGRPRQATSVLAVEFFLVALLLYPGINLFGIIGAASVVVICRGISVLLFLRTLRRFLFFTRLDLWNMVKYKLFCSLCMGLLVFSIHYFFLPKPNLVSLVSLILIGLISYCFFIFLTERSLFREARMLLQQNHQT